MATVTKNPDDTYTVTLTAKEQKTLKRWGEEPLPGHIPGQEPRPKAAQLERIIHGALKLKAEEHRAADGPKMGEKYDALPDDKKAQVDAILNGGS